MQQKGFTLIEIIVTISVVLVAFGLCALEFTALQISRKQRYEDIAYQIATREMEDLRGTPFASLPANGTTSFADSSLSQIPSGADSLVIADYPGYTGVKQITVTVSWLDGTTKSVVLQTLAQANGLNQ